MENEKIENLDSENETEQTENQEEAEETTEESEESQEESVEDLKKKVTTLEAQKEHWRKKANEKKPDTTKKETVTPKNDELSTKDLYALIEAKVPQEDVEEVVKAAKLLGKPVSEALKDDLVKTRLSQLAEFRKSADATNTGNQRRVTKKVTDEQIVSEASKGNIPAKGSEDAERLFWARRGGKRE